MQDFVDDLYKLLHAHRSQGDSGDAEGLRLSQIGLPLSYDLLLRAVVPLNHDRFKSYFNYFLVLQIGLLTLIFTRAPESLIGDAGTQILFTRALSGLGMLSCTAWLLILLKIVRDIRLAWHTAIHIEHEARAQVSLAEDYVFGSSQLETRYTRLVRFVPASGVMTVFPIVFLVVYGLVLATIG